MLIVGLIILLIIFLIWSDSYCEKQLQEHSEQKSKEVSYNSSCSDNKPSMYEIMRRMGMWD